LVSDQRSLKGEIKRIAEDYDERERLDKEETSKEREEEQDEKREEKEQSEVSDPLHSDRNH
jgi:hypothetical protein